MRRRRWSWCGCLLAALGVVAGQSAKPPLWEERLLDGMATPLAALPRVKHAAAETYYRLPEVEIYRTYPVYRPDREPPNYLAFLQAQDPVLEWDASKLASAGDWIRAGEALFDMPTRIGRMATGVSIDELQDAPFIDSREWFETVKPPVGFDGTLPGFRYVIRKKGKIEIGWNACAMCHSRVMPDGLIVAGPPGEFPFDAFMASEIRHAGRAVGQLEFFRKRLVAMYAVPGAKRGQELWNAIGGFDNQQMARLFDGHPGGAMSIDGAAPWALVKVPDLIGLGDRPFLGATASYRQMNSEDLARYIAHHLAGEAMAGPRFSDAQLMALVRFVESLKAPKNPHKPNSFTKKGKAIFDREGCARCHVGAGERLTLAAGFRPSPEEAARFGPVLLAESVGTDPALAMETRLGTGYYRVPELSGIWYRGPFGHSGNIEALEHWFSGMRLRDDFFSAGFGGLGGARGAVRGHEFGMKLNDQELAALLGYLRTL